MTSIHHLSAAQLLEAYARRTLSPVEVAKSALDRIDEVDAKINAFCYVDGDAAMLSARASEARWMAGAPIGLLDGVTATIKDVVLTKGWPTRKGSRTVSVEGPWNEDSPPTARLREHNAVILGKTTTPEFGWKAVGDSPLTGITRNPWSLDHTSGGSSAGAAASVAAGMGALAVGSDGGGSIRIPASFCGVVGIKPTLGRVPYYPPSAMGILGHCGPIARSCEDAALMLTVLSGADPRDAYSLPPITDDFRDGLHLGVGGLRVAFSPTLGYASVDDEVRTLVAAAARRMEELGARVEEVDPGFESPRDMFDILWKSGAANVISGMEAASLDILDPGFVKSACEGMQFSAVEYVQADFARTRLGKHMAEFHQRFDLLLTPTVGKPALPVGTDLSDPTERSWIDWASFSYPFNMTRQPAVSVPCGYTKSGLPVGLQIVGPLYSDALVLRAAAAFEGVSPATVWPEMASDGGHCRSKSAQDAALSSR